MSTTQTVIFWSWVMALVAFSQCSGSDNTADHKSLAPSSIPSSTYPQVDNLIRSASGRCSIGELEQIKQTGELMMARGTVRQSDLSGFPECMSR